MGIIRGGLLVIVSVLLFLAFFAGAMFFTISWSLGYENVQPSLKTVVNDVLSEQQLDLESFLGEEFSSMENYCHSYSNYVITYQNKIITVPCSVVFQGQDAVVNYGVGQFIEKIYFAQYDCDFWSCFSEDQIPFFLVSAKSQYYFYSLFNYVMLFILILSILGFLLSERKSNFFLLVAVLVILASLPFAKFDVFTGFFGGVAQGLLFVFFSKAYSVFFSMLVLGIILLAIGLVLKLFRIGFKIQTIFAREDKVSKEDVKEIVKEEVRKDKGKEFKKKKPKKKAKKDRKSR